MISIRGLDMRFEAHTVLKGIDLEVVEGEILALLGSSGGGKTTLLRCISGLNIPTAGQVVVDGVDVVKRPDEARRKMGMVFQSAALFDYMNVSENIRFGLHRHRKLEQEQEKNEVFEALARVGLEHTDATKMPAELSGGMKKRVGIARALVLKPRVMLYDEPTTGLDPITTYAIDQLIRDVRNELKMTSLLVSHDVTSVLRVSDRVAFLNEGSLIFLGTPAEFAASDEPHIRELVTKAQAISLK